MSESFREIEQKTFERIIPFRALWEVTSRCNLNCLHCFHTADTGRELSGTEARKILKEIAQAGTLYLALSGGEVLTRKDWRRILADAVASGLVVRLYTNATLIGAEEAEFIASCGPAAVDVSVYGREEVHDSITRVRGSHRKTIAALHSLHEHGVQVTIKTPMLRHNAGEIEWARRLAEELSAGFVFDPLVYVCQDGTRTPLEHAADDATIEEVLAELSSGKPVEPGSNLEPGKPLCSAGRNAFHVTPSGKVTPCVALPQVMGDLRKQSFAEIWQAAKWDKIRNMTLEDLRDCLQCELREWCVRCPGNALLEDGDLFGCSTASRRIAAIRKRLSEKSREPERLKDEG